MLSMFIICDSINVWKKLKWAYVKNRDEFVRKFRLKYPSIFVSEIANFIQIYLIDEPDENNDEKSELHFDDWIWISRISFVGPCLKEEGQLHLDNGK